MSDALPLKYRPKTFDDFVGNQSAINSLKSLLDKPINKIPKSFLFSGPSGCGKTTLARIAKNYLKCHDMAFYEYNASNTRGVDTIRKIQSEIGLYPPAGDIKIYLLDECHRLTVDAMNALLKLLEDAPENVFFFLATTDPEMLIKAIRSRCSDIKVNKLPLKSIIQQLCYVLDEEIGKDERKDFEDNGIIKEISKQCDGAMRDALKLLDSVIDMEDFDDMLEVIKEGFIDESPTLIELCRLLNDKKTKWKQISPVLKNFDEDPEKARRSILGYFSKVLLSSGSKDHAIILESFKEPYFNTGKAGLILSCCEVIL